MLIKRRNNLLIKWQIIFVDCRNRPAEEQSESSHHRSKQKTNDSIKTSKIEMLKHCIAATTPSIEKLVQFLNGHFVGHL